MHKAAIETYLSAMKGADASFPFGPEALVFKVMGKMFALVSQQEEVPRLTLKCLPEDGALLTGQFESIIPGYHMNKRHWITIYLNGEVPQAMIKELANNSYDLVVDKLSRADKTRLDKM